MLQKILSTVLLIFGIGIFIFGSYVANEASRGEEKIANAEENAQGQRRPVLGPIRRGARSAAAETNQKKISAGEQKIVKSQVTANWLRGTGIAIFVVGVGCLYFSFSHKKRD